MNFEGKVMIEFCAGSDAHVRVDYHKPVEIVRILRGKAPHAVPGMLAMVHSVCGNAQAHASVLALEAALDISSDPVTARSRAVLTALETWRETLLRIVLEWPDITGDEPDSTTARAGMTLLPRMKKALFGDGDPFAIDARATPDMHAALQIVGEIEKLTVERVLGEACEHYLARRGDEGLSDWAGSRSTQAAVFVRHLLARGWMEQGHVEAAALDLPDHANKMSRWLAIALAGRLGSGRAVPETTPFSRRLNDPCVASLASLGIGARFVARLTELASLPLEMHRLLAGEGRPSAVSASIDGHGTAIVEAARGLLAHVARLVDGEVADYWIVAPTDWNFHRQGIAARCLEAVGGHAERDALAHLVVRAIDPCVAYEMRGEMRAG
ncbi:MAG: nickel-dependent hydrogenase large subunit [Nitratireductor sp.]|nr:nickel-dependent hydrogenase large subunit [Nitratireductor sp.]